MILVIMTSKKGPCFFCRPPLGVQRVCFRLDPEVPRRGENELRSSEKEARPWVGLLICSLPRNPSFGSNIAIKNYDEMILSL